MRFSFVRFVKDIISNKSQHDTTLYERKINQQLKSFKNQEINHGQLVGHLSYILVHELNKSVKTELETHEMKYLVMKLSFWITLVLYLSLYNYYAIGS